MSQPRHERRDHANNPHHATDSSSEEAINAWCGLTINV
jgi:hypothetical protein